MLTKSAYICLSKNLLTKFAYQNVLIEEFACICLKTSFMQKYFRPLKVWRAGRAGDLAFAMSYYFLNCLA